MVVEVDVVTVRTVSVDVKHHVYLLTYLLRSVTQLMFM